MMTMPPGRHLLSAGAVVVACAGSVVARDARGTPGGAHELRNTRHRPSAPVGAATKRDTVPVRSLLLWGGIDAEGAPRLDPVFVIDAPPTPPRASGAYRLAGRSRDGDTLFSLAFEMPVVADADGASSFLFMLPVEPDWEGRLASVTLTGPGGATTLDENSHRPMAIVRDARTGRIQAILRDLPPTVRTQAIADTAVARTPTQEVLFSRGIPGPAAWRR